MARTVNIQKRWEDSFFCTPVLDFIRDDGARVYRVISNSGAIYRVILKENDPGWCVRGCNCRYGYAHDPCSCKHVLSAINLMVHDMGNQAIMPVENGYDWESIKGCTGAIELAEGYQLLIGKGNNNGQE